MHRSPSQTDWPTHQLKAVAIRIDPSRGGNEMASACRIPDQPTVRIEASERLQIDWGSLLAVAVGRDRRLRIQLGLAHHQRLMPAHLDRARRLRLEGPVQPVVVAGPPAARSVRRRRQLFEFLFESFEASKSLFCSSSRPVSSSRTGSSVMSCALIWFLSWFLSLLLDYVVRLRSDAIVLIAKSLVLPWFRLLRVPVPAAAMQSRYRFAMHFAPVQNPCGAVA